MAATLFHNSFAVNDLDRARKFYGEILECPEGRKLPNRVDFNFFGHHIVAHLSPKDVYGEEGGKVARGVYFVRSSQAPDSKRIIVLNP